MLANAWSDWPAPWTAPCCCGPTACETRPNSAGSSNPEPSPKHTMPVHSSTGEGTSAMEPINIYASISQNNPPIVNFTSPKPQLINILFPYRRGGKPAKKEWLLGTSMWRRTRTVTNAPGVVRMLPLVNSPRVGVCGYTGHMKDFG